MVTGPTSLDEYDVAGGAAHEFYAQVGKVVTRAALMEWWLFHLACTLDGHTPQHEMAPRFADAHVKICRAAAGQLRPDLQTAVVDLIDRLEQVRLERNAVVHSVWPHPGDPAGYGHRPKPRAMKPTAADWIEDQNFPAERLEELASRIEGLVGELMSVCQNGIRP